MTDFMVIALGGALMLGSASTGAQPMPVPMVPTKPIMNEETRHPNLNFERDYNSKILMTSAEAQRRSYADATAVAACVSRRAGNAAANLLGGEMTDDPSFSRLLNALSGRFSGCVSERAVGVPMMIINGALAEELLHRAKPALPDRLSSATPAARAFYESAAGPTIETVGRCLAALSPGLAYRVLEADAASKAEQEALGALYASTPACGLAGPPADIAPAIQRSAVASGIYQWIHRGNTGG